MSATALRPGLPPLPERMAHLAIDERGYPVPFFVAYVDGKPDHRIMDGAKLRHALRYRLCWQCGKLLEQGKPFVFAIGPMCCITRTIAEPPAHIECLRYAATACPFLTRPHAHRRDAGMPEDTRIAGVGLRRNPGVICLWSTGIYRPFGDGKGGLLFNIGPQCALEWWAEGRAATLAEVDGSVCSGLPLLFEQAEAEDAEFKRRGLLYDRPPHAVRELKRRIAEFDEMLASHFGAKADGGVLEGTNRTTSGAIGQP